MLKESPMALKVLTINYCIYSEKRGFHQEHTYTLLGASNATDLSGYGWFGGGGEINQLNSSAMFKVIAIGSIVNFMALINCIDSVISSL